MIRTTIFTALTGISLLFAANEANAQKYFTRNAKVDFDATAKTSPEKIDGSTNNGTLVLDKSSGDVQVAVLVKGFKFEKALMEEHFNENYMESSKYPKAEFKGKFDNPGALDFSKDGSFTVNVTGTMTLHGVSKTITLPVSFSVKGGQTYSSCKFNLPLADYKVDIPSLVADKIAKQASIAVSANLAPLAK